MSNWWWGKVLKQFQIISEFGSKSCHDLERGQYLIFWVGWAKGNWRFNSISLYLFIFFFFFQISICSIPKALARFKFASALLYSNPTFYRGLNSGLSCTCTDSRIFNAPNFPQNTFLCKSAVQVDRTLMSFSFGKLLFFSRNPCVERESGWGS